MNIPDTTTTPTKDLAAILGLSTQSIAVLRRNGTIEQTSKGRYDLEATVQAYIAFKSGRRHVESANQLARLNAARADKAQLEADTLSGERVKAADVAAVLLEVGATFNAQWAGMPGRLVNQLADKDPEQIKSALEEEARRIRAATTKRITEYAGEVAAGISANAGTRAKAHTGPVGRR